MNAEIVHVTLPADLCLDAMAPLCTCRGLRLTTTCHEQYPHPKHPPTNCPPLRGHNTATLKDTSKSNRTSSSLNRPCCLQASLSGRSCTETAAGLDLIACDHRWKQVIAITNKFVINNNDDEYKPDLKAQLVGNFRIRCLDYDIMFRSLTLNSHFVRSTNTWRCNVQNKGLRKMWPQDIQRREQYLVNIKKNKPVNMAVLSRSLGCNWIGLQDNGLWKNVFYSLINYGR